MAGKGFHSLAIDVGGRLIFKFPEGAEAEAALLREARLLAAVSPHVSLPVPMMSVHKVGSRVFSRHEKLRGDSLTREGYATLKDSVRQCLAEDLALFLSQLHALDYGSMKAAGALPVEWWDTSDEALAPIWPLLPAPVAREGQQAIAEYRAMSSDLYGDVYGFFDAHGWNMAFDPATGRLNGIFDFADSGFGPIHREFAPISLISPDLAARTADAYGRLTGRDIEPTRIFLLTAAMRLSEFAGALATNDLIDWTRGLVIEWFEQRVLR